MTDEVGRLIAGLPKVELHLHLVGAASLATVLELARRHPDGGVPTDPGALRDFYHFTDFAHFKVYIAVNSSLRTAADVYALVWGVAGDLAAQQVRYAELTVTPDSHLRVGIPPDGLAAALIEGRSRAQADHGRGAGMGLRCPPGSWGSRRGSGPSNGWSGGLGKECRVWPRGTGARCAPPDAGTHRRWCPGDARLGQPGHVRHDAERRYRIAHDVFGMSAAQLADLSRTGIEVSYADAARKQQLRREVDDYICSAPQHG